MLIRAVIGHKVENHLQPAGVCLTEKSIEVAEGAEKWMDIGIVRDVVTEVLHRRWIDRRDPHSVDAEPTQVIEPGNNPRKVANAVAIAVHKGTRVHLIDHAALPPEVGPCQVPDFPPVLAHLLDCAIFHHSHFPHHELNIMCAQAGAGKSATAA